MNSLNVRNLAENIYSFTSNSYFISGKIPVIIDSGNDNKILERLKEATDKLDKILITHLHPDHVGLTQNIKDEFGATVYAWKKTKDWIDEEFTDEQDIDAGNSSLEVVHTPGHSSNHVVFYGEGALFSGDLIFPGGSFGRTDLPGGSQKILVKSIERILSKYGNGIKELYPGHMQFIKENASDHVNRSLKMARSF